MESDKTIVYCPNHKSEPIKRVSTEIGVAKTLFCIECLIDGDVPVDKSKLKSIDDFLETAVNYYNSSKQRSTTGESFPTDYQDILDAKASIVEKFKEHIQKEKDQVQSAFEKIYQEVFKRLNKKREDLMEELNRQQYQFIRNYEFFEKQLRKTYPQAEDYSLFPTKEEIIDRYMKCSNFQELQDFVRGIQEDLNEEKRTENKDIFEGRRELLKTLSKDLKEIENIKPTFMDQEPDKQFAKTVQDFEKFVDSLYCLQNEVWDIAAGDVTYTFDPKAPFANLYNFTNGNKTVSSNSTGLSIITAKNPIPKGKASSFTIKVGNNSYYIMIGLVPQSALSNKQGYNDANSIGYGQEGTIYNGKGKGSVNLKANDKVTVKVEKGNIKFLVNKVEAFNGKLPNPDLVYYPFVYTNCTLGIEATFEK